MLGRIEYIPGVWVRLDDDRVWRGDIDADALEALNRIAGPDGESPADGPAGSSQVRRAVEILGCRYEMPTSDPPPEGAAY